MAILGRLRLGVGCPASKPTVFTDHRPEGRWRLARHSKSNHAPVPCPGLRPPPRPARRLRRRRGAELLRGASWPPPTTSRPLPIFSWRRLVGMVVVGWRVFSDGVGAAPWHNARVMVDNGDLPAIPASVPQFPQFFHSFSQRKFWIKR